MARPIKREPLVARPIQRDRLSPFQFNAEPGRYDSMPYRRCGKSGLKLPAISLGAWETFGGYRSYEVARECIFRAFNLGITHFDLANNYGQPPGKAETVVGRVLRDMPRDEVIVSTKAGFPMWEGPYGSGGSRKHLLASIDQSLARLELGYVDIFYSHRMDHDTPLEETLGALDEIVRSGRALHVGLCNYSGEQLRAALRIVEERQLAPIVLEQSVYNMLQRGIEQDLLPVCREAGVGLITFSPLAQGLLSAKYLEELPAESRGALLWSEEHRARLTPGAAATARATERAGGGAWSNAGTNGHRVGGAPAGNHERPDRRVRGGPDRGEREGAGERAVQRGRAESDRRASLRVSGRRGFRA